MHRPLHLSDKVGIGCRNLTADVMQVQALLSAFCVFIRTTPLRTDGVCGQRTVSAIRIFQQKIAGMRHPDGIIGPSGPTWRLLSDFRTVRKAQRAHHTTKPPAKHAAAETAKPPASASTGSLDFQKAAERMGRGIDPLLIAAFAKVESGGKSGFGADGLPIIAYEGHIFRKYTAHKYDVTNPLLSYPYKKKAGPEWQINNANQAQAWKTLTTAATLDHDAALMACSWGMFQVMGFNAQSCGYAKVDDFVAAMKAGEQGQLDAFVGFCISKRGMLKAMAEKDFVAMATLYNGEDYGDYDQRIKNAYKKLKGNP